MSELAPSNKKQVYKTWPRQIFFFRSTLPFALNVQSEAAFYLILSCCTLWLLSLPEGPQHRELNGESLLLGDCCAWVAVCNRSLLTPPPTAAEISCQMLSPCKQYCVIMLLITRNNHIRHSNKSATTLSRAAQPHSKNKNKKQNQSKNVPSQTYHRSVDIHTTGGLPSEIKYQMRLKWVFFFYIHSYLSEANYNCIPRESKMLQSNLGFFRKTSWTALAMKSGVQLKMPS